MKSGTKRGPRFLAIPKAVLNESLGKDLTCTLDVRDLAWG